MDEPLNTLVSVTSHISFHVVRHLLTDQESAVPMSEGILKLRTRVYVGEDIISSLGHRDPHEESTHVVLRLSK